MGPPRFRESTRDDKPLAIQAIQHSCDNSMESGHQQHAIKDSITQFQRKARTTLALRWVYRIPISNGERTLCRLHTADPSQQQHFLRLLQYRDTVWRRPVSVQLASIEPATVSLNKQPSFRHTWTFFDRMTNHRHSF